MAKGKSVIRNFLSSPDTMAMIDAIEMFGAKVRFFDDLLEVEGVGGKLQRPNDVINAGNSGQVLRFIAGIAALNDSYVVITGDESIRTRRPIKPLLETLTSQNIFAESTTLNGRPPIIVKGPMKPGVMAIDGSDSQPVSALLIATSFLPGDSEIYVMNPGEKPWIDVTLSWLKKFNITVDNHDYRHYKVYGKANYEGFDITIPGDFSSAAYPLVAALISKQKIKISGLNMDDSHADRNFINILVKLGAKIQHYPEENLLVADGRCEIEGMKIDVNDCIDSTPILAVLGCYAKAPIEIVGAKIARFKESDRISAIAQELRKMGGQIKEREDGMIIYPSPLNGAELFSHKDHRIALSLIVAAFGAKGETTIEGVEYIAKTYPTFLYDFMQLGGRIT